MKILAFDTSNDGLSAALLENEKVIELLEVQESNRQSELLILLLEQLLRNRGIWYQDLDLIACTKGPGSFTGVRVGLTCAKTLQISTAKPLITLDSLEVIAYRAVLLRRSQHDKQSPPILVVNDAKMDEFFVAEFQMQNDKLAQTTESRLVNKIELEEFLSKKNYFLCGTSQNDRITADLVGQLAYEKFLEGDTFDSNPNYLRGPRITQRKK